MEILRAEGIKAGLIRPITLFPFPDRAFRYHAARPEVRGFVSVELSTGQMIEDVRLAVDGKKPVSFFGRCGGAVMSEDEIVAFVKGGAF